MSFSRQSGGPPAKKAVKKPSSASTAGPAAAPARRKISEVRFGAKTSDPFSTSSNVSMFVSAFNRRDLPCVLATGSVRSKLDWKIPLEAVSFDPVLRLLASGLTETKHPYYFVARCGFKDLCEAPDAGIRGAPLAADVIGSIRECLMSPNSDVYQAGLDALEQFARAVGPPLVPHLKRVIGQLAKNMTKPKLRDRLTDVLIALEESCGPECLKLIKKAVPVYSSVM
eukprot:m.24868 g.24868  ORF g.24868 m.24868 type:complete len:226 (-) comp11358_c0_seq1:1027-1704(-)